MQIKVSRRSPPSESCKRWSCSLQDYHLKLAWSWRLQESKPQVAQTWMKVSAMMHKLIENLIWRHSWSREDNKQSQQIYTKACKRRSQMICKCDRSDAMLPAWKVERWEQWCKIRYCLQDMWSISKAGPDIWCRANNALCKKLWARSTATAMIWESARSTNGTWLSAKNATCLKIGGAKTCPGPSVGILQEFFGQCQ